MRLFDTHSHYNDEKFDEDRQEIIKSTIESGVEKFICAGYSLESSIDAVKIANENKSIYSIVGISPNDVSESLENIDDEISEIKELANNKKVVAIGEIGLDFYWNKENKDIQKEYFIKQIELANELNLPIVIHTREAISDTLDILKNIQKANKCGIIHCCPLNRELVKEALKLGFYISFAGPVTFKNSKNADEIINMVPLDKMLIETDSPYLSPEPLRGRRNDSRNVKYIAGKIASVRNMNLDEIAEITFNNALKIFNIED